MEPSNFHCAIWESKFQWYAISWFFICPHKSFLYYLLDRQMLFGKQKTLVYARDFKKEAPSRVEAS